MVFKFLYIDGVEKIVKVVDSRMVILYKVLQFLQIIFGNAMKASQPSRIFNLVLCHNILFKWLLKNTMLSMPHNICVEYYVKCRKFSNYVSFMAKHQPL